VIRRRRGDGDDERDALLLGTVQSRCYGRKKKSKAPHQQLRTVGISFSAR